MYTKMCSIIINMMFGGGVLYSGTAILLLIDGAFATGWRDYFCIGVITIAWLSFCIEYNYLRYKKTVEGVLSYGKKTYFFTLIFPLSFWSVFMGLLYFYERFF